MKSQKRTRLREGKIFQAPPPYSCTRVLTFISFGVSSRPSSRTIRFRPPSEGLPSTQKVLSSRPKARPPSLIPLLVTTSEVKGLFHEP